MVYFVVILAFFFLFDLVCGSGFTPAESRPGKKRDHNLPFEDELEGAATIDGAILGSWRDTAFLKALFGSVLPRAWGKGRGGAGVVLVRVGVLVRLGPFTI